MNESKGLSFLEYFSSLNDPRVDRTKRHELLDIIAIAICAVICGMESWVDIEDFGEAREQWLKKFLKLPNGIPSHDTFSRVFSLLDPKQFQECFQNWVSALCRATNGEVIAVDGKTLRRSFDKAAEQSPFHLVSAWASTNNLTLGQVLVEDKSNEIVAIPKLLEIIDVTGSIVTIDAIGCQKAFAEQITNAGGDYIFCLKENHPNFHNEVKSFFEKGDFQGRQHSFSETTDGEHGRIEIRKYWSVSAESFEHQKDWEGIKSIGMVESHREVGEKQSLERRYYISSLEQDSERFGKAVRSHWGIENSLHWVLDVIFNEDQCRIREKNAAQNFALLRRIAISLLKNEKSSKKSLRRKRNQACLYEDYLLKILQANAS